MTTNHIDQLKEWYAQAESGPVNVGDTVIYRHAGQWIVDVSTVPYDNPDNRDIRILARAPKPKPAWHDAVAVIAHKYGDYGLTPREVFQNVGSGQWGSTRYFAKTEDLVDPVPLIEAKVTDETVDRVLDVLHAWSDTYPAGLGTKLAAAALGIETE